MLQVTMQEIIAVDMWISEINPCGKLIPFPSEQVMVIRKYIFIGKPLAIRLQILQPRPLRVGH